MKNVIRFLFCKLITISKSQSSLSRIPSSFFTVNMFVISIFWLSRIQSSFYHFCTSKKLVSDGVLLVSTQLFFQFFTESSSWLQFQAVALASVFLSLCSLLAVWIYVTWKTLSLFCLTWQVAHHIIVSFQSYFLLQISFLIPLSKLFLNF